VAKLLKTLAADGIILSHRGATGGYALTRPPEAITVTQIISSLEGPIALTACVEGSGDYCGVEPLCPMRGNWEKVNGAIRGALDKLTLADMAMTAIPAAFGVPASALPAR
jgi:Rrf2 family protein